MTSTIKVNNIQNQCGQNIINENSNTITLGASGDTIALASGASQTGFGRTGTVDWDTTPKTATFTAVSGDGFFANTTGGAFNMNLPAGSAGAIVSVADYAGTWQNNALTVVPNGSDKIGGFNSNVTLSTEGQSVTFVFVDSTQGWVNTMDSTSNERGTAFVTASGGNAVVTNGNFKTHIFTGPGTFCVSCAGNPGGSDTVDYFVVAGGGGGGNDTFGSGCRGGGGAGGGGFRISNSAGCLPAPSMSPLVNPTGLPVSATGYPITAGGGGSGGVPGGPSNVGGDGGVGSFIACAMVGPTAPSYGTPGPATGRYFSGGGGSKESGSGGAGGGAAASGGAAATVNTGGGGGGQRSANAGNGGSGIVMIRYKFQ